MSDLIKSLQKESKYYPLTHPQLGIWNVEKMYSGTSISNIAGTVRIVGEVRYDLLEKAINLLIERNDALRIRITEEAGQPSQFVTEYTYKKIDMIDFSKFENPLEALYKWDEEQTRIPFKLCEDELSFFAIIKLSNNEGGFYAKLHHLISDAWTMSIVGNKVIEYYSLFKNKNSIPHEELISYFNYLQSEKEYLTSERFLKDKEYWEKVFEICPEISTLKTRTTNIVESKSRRKTLLTPVKFTNKLREYCKENNITPFPLFIAALSIYVNRVTGVEDITIGTPILNRTNQNEKNTIGMFINTIPIRININRESDFKAFSECIFKESFSLLRHQKYPYNILLKEVRKRFNLSDNLFDIVLSYQNSKFKRELYNENCSSRWHFNGCQSNSLTIHVNDRDNEGKLIIDYDFHEDLFFIKEIEYIHKYIISILWHALDNPNKHISKIEMLPESEKNKVLYTFNNTNIDYLKDKTVHQLFEEQVELTPDKIALVYENNSITYKELNEKSNKLARLIREKGVKPNNIVGIMVDRSLEMVIGILAVLKSGGAYLPIDINLPNERKKYTLKDSRTKLLLTNNCIYLNYYSNEIVDIFNSKNYLCDDNNLENINKISDLAYVIYTSGTTGESKGVMVTHSNIINLSYWFNKEYSISNKNVINIADYTFDVSVEEIIVSLINNATVFIPNKDTLLDKNKFIKFIKDNKINIAQFVPTLLKELLLNIDKIDPLNLIISGGEALEEDLKNRIIKKGYFLYNHYGPTECTVDATVSKCSLDSKVIIGKPIFNTKCYILDKNLNLLPIGIPGELFISGDGVSKGYINDIKLTNQKFIDNPFELNKILYKTGDIARWFVKGDIEFLGRADQQIKLRGYRIELEEIEKEIMKSTNIKEAIVIMKENIKGKKIICAYLVTQKRINILKLKDNLIKKLPSYMIPSYITTIDKLPLNSNGKIDRNKLPSPSFETNKKWKYESPRNETEQIIKEVWEKVLKINNISINDNFFELGGDSLSIIEVLIQLFSYNFSINSQDFFQHPTIKLLSNKINKNNNQILEIDDYIYPYNLRKKTNFMNNNFESQNILLTGSTGLLGIHILEDLLLYSNCKIYCLVRGINKEHAKNKLINMLEFYFGNKYNKQINDRVFIINGDITINYFSLSEKEYELLGNKINIVIHSASISKPYGNNIEYFKVNINGTNEIVKFCKTFKLSLSFISTILVSGNYIFNKTNEYKIFTENDSFIGQDYKSNLYVNSKFEAEQLVFKAINEGLNANVIRIGNLSGRYSDGQFQFKITENSFYNRIMSIIRIKAIPISMINQRVYFTPVDLCSKAIVNIIRSTRNIERVFHVFNHNYIIINDLISILNNINININVLEDDVFTNYITSICKNKTKSKWLKGIINDFNKDRILNYESSINVDSFITLKYLEKQNFKWNKIDKEYICKLINYMKTVNFI